MADTYQVQRLGADFIIYNVDTKTGYSTGELTDRVILKLSPLGPPETFNFGGVSGGTAGVGFEMIRVTNVTDDEITFKSIGSNIIGYVSDDFPDVQYGIDFKLNATTGEINALTLVPYDPSQTDDLIDLGF